jgi:gamma-glutamyltranspeptidase/glutathione hydrolase
MPDIPFDSRRSPIYATRGMVAASQPLAVAAGLEILSRGGNAADAAIAVAAALNVTQPNSTGLGGDCFALYYDRKSTQVSALNGSGRAPASLTLERLAKEGFTHELPPFHPYTITVPGACAGWCDLIERHGQLSMSAILAPAIRLAEEGFPVSPITAYFWQRGARNQLRTAPGGQELTIEGRGPHPGEIFRNPGLARTLRRIASNGKAVFYQGEIAEAIAGAVQSTGGCLSLADLATHHSTWDEPISTIYRGVRIWECPPNGQGLAALLGLNILEGFNLASMEALSPARLHLEIEAMRLAFADTRWYIADPAFNPLPLQELLSKDYAAARRKLINPARATLDQTRGAPIASSDTVYFCVVDGSGNGCSFVNSNYAGFGTGIVPSGWGFSLQNRGHNFSLDSHHPNALAPGKRPYHTIIPGLATIPSSGQGNANPRETLFGVFGVMGGFMQPQGHLQVIIGLVDDHLDPQSILDRPRFCIMEGNPAGKVSLEEGVPNRTLAALAGMGHTVKRLTGYQRSIFGYGQIILSDPHTGIYCGGSDPRIDGCAMTY